MNQNFPGIFAEVDSPNSHLIKIMWSGFYFALAFIFINYFDHALTAFCAYLLDYHPHFSYNGLKPLIETVSPWTVKRVAFIYLTAPLVCLLISAGLVFVLYTSNSKSHTSLFLFWFSINAFALFYSYFFTGIIGAGKYNSIFYSGFTVYLTWLYVGTGKIIMLLTLLIIFFSFFSLMFGRLVFRYSYSGLLLKTREGRIVVFINTVLFPFIVGAAIVTVITYPLDYEYMIIRLLSMVVILFMMFIGIQASGKTKKTFNDKGGISYRSPLLLILAIALLAFLLKYVLSVMVEL